MKTYRLKVITMRSKAERKLKCGENVEIIKTYIPNQLFEKWLESEIRVPLMELILKEIIGDKVVLAEIKKLIFNHLYKQEVYSVSKYRDVYYEIKEVIKYASNTIDIDVDEAKTLIESGLTEVKFKDGNLDLTTILNEREVDG